MSINTQFLKFKSQGFLKGIMIYPTYAFNDPQLISQATPLSRGVFSHENVFVCETVDNYRAQMLIAFSAVVKHGQKTRVQRFFDAL